MGSWATMARVSCRVTMRASCLTPMTRRLFRILLTDPAKLLGDLPVLLLEASRKFHRQLHGILPKHRSHCGPPLSHNMVGHGRRNNPNNPLTIHMHLHSKLPKHRYPISLALHRLPHTPPSELGPHRHPRRKPRALWIKRKGIKVHMIYLRI